MNNWRLLLLAVIAVLEPIPSFTEGNLIDGRRECCDHGPSSIAPDIRLYGTFDKSGFNVRRLVSRESVRDQRQEAKRDATTGERRALERNERRHSPTSAPRSSTDSRFAGEQEGRSRNPLEARDGVDRRIHDTRSANRYERDVLDSRRRMSREDVRRDVRLYGGSHSRRVRTSDELRRVSTMETMSILRRERDDVTRDQRDSRLNSASRIQLHNTRDRTYSAVRNNERENRVFYSLNSRVNENREIVREEPRNNLDRTLDRISHERRHDSRNTDERVDRVREYRKERQIDERRQRDENRLSRERSSTHRESEQRQDPVATRQSRDFQSNTRLSRTMSSNDRSNNRGETPENIPRLSRNVATERDERFVRYRRDVKSMERLDESRQREIRMSRDRTFSKVRGSRNDVRRHEAPRSSRSDRVSRTRENLRDNERIDLHREREQMESKEQIVIRVSRDNERRQERKPNKISLARYPSSIDRVSRNREAFANVQNRNLRDNIETRYVAASQPQYNNLLTSRSRENIRVVRSRTTKDMSDNVKRDMSRERDVTRESRQRISEARLSRERTEEQRREIRAKRDSRVDIRREVIRNRGDVRLGVRFEVRQSDNREHRDRVSLYARDNRVERSFEGRLTFSRNRNMDAQTERKVNNRDDRRINERLVRNNRDIRGTTRHASRQIEVREDQARSLLSLDREIKHVTQNRMEAKVRPFDATFDVRANTKNERSDNKFSKRETMEISLRNFESAKSDPTGETLSESQIAMNWQLVIYTLQGVYLCGLLMNMLTEKSNKGYTRNFPWRAHHKDLVKVD